MKAFDDNFECSQCGGELYPEDGQLFITCPYCTSALFVSKGGIVFHWYLACTFDQEQAKASLSRWLSRDDIGVDLENDAQLTHSSFAYFPFWMIRKEDSGDEEVSFEPATATSVTELRNLHLPGGNLLRYSEEIDSLAFPPTVPLTSVINRMEGRGMDVNGIAEVALIHIPIHTFKYQHRGREYTALVEGSSGKVFSNIHPEKSRRLYMTLSLVTAAAFICLGTFPCIGSYISENHGRTIGLTLCTGLGSFVGIAAVAVAGWLAGEK